MNKYTPENLHEFVFDFIDSNDQIRDYFMDIHMKQYAGCDDDAPEDFENYIMDMENKELNEMFIKCINALTNDNE